MRSRRILTIMVLGVTVCLTEVSEASSMGTAFTYQGHLYDANYVANGLYDFAFKLYDANVGGSKVGTDVNVADVDVVDAYFTVELDFNDVNAFNGDARWLEIGVRAGNLDDPNAYTTLGSRQEVTPTPYAIYAQRSDIEVPLSLTGSTDVEWIIGAINNGNGPALGGISLAGYGVRGQSTSGYSVLGTNTGGNYGYLGGSDYGVYGKHASSDNIGFLGSSDYGVYGQHAGSGNTGFLGGSTCGAYGYSSGNYGLLGTSSYGVYGNSSSDTNYAGYFSGRGYFSGNVGIGTTSPAEMLHIYKSSGSLGLRVSSDSSSYQYMNFGATNGYSIGRAPDDKLFINRDEPLGSGALRVLTVQPNGFVGIGTATPGEELTVEGTIKANAEYKAVEGYASNTVGTTTYGGYFVADGNGLGVFAHSSGTSGWGVQGWTSGSEGYGVYGYDSNSDGGVGVYGHAGGYYGLGVAADGHAWDFMAMGPGDDYGSFSSIRWKKNIQPIDNPLDKVLQLRGVYFDWDEGHGGEHDVGMIAEEVGQVLPEIVQYEEDGIYTIGMDYSKMAPLLVEAIKALKIENDELKRRLEVLEAAIGKSEEGDKK